MPNIDPRKVETGISGFGGGGAKHRFGGYQMPKTEPRLIERQAKPAQPGARSTVKDVSEGGKGYAEQRYTVSVPVKVRWPDGSLHVDEIKGMNVGHALTRARDNWPGATITQGGKPIKLKY